MAKLRSPGGDTGMEETSITLPAEMATLLRLAASRVAFWEDDGQTNVSKYVVKILEWHREVIEREAQPEMRL